MVRNGLYKFNAANDLGFTALMAASLNGHTATVEWLLSQGVEIERKNKFGHTALHIAVTEGYMGVVKTLLAQDAEVAEEIAKAAQAKGWARMVSILQGLAS